MRYSHVLWDFNGTILNDVEAVISSENTILKRRNMSIIQDEKHYKDIFCFPVIEYYKKLGHDFEKEDFDVLAHEWIEQYLNYSKSSKLQRGILEALQRIEAKGIKQVVLSASEKGILKKQLEELKIASYFDDILGLSNIHASSKVEIAKEWIKNKNIQKAILIGDTTHDYEVATAIGIDCILISSGHQSKERLIGCGVPIFEDIISLLESQLFNFF